MIKAAKYEVAINAHEPIKGTGLRRTYPNTISREGLRGQEFNAWSPDGGNPPEHLPIVAFTRMLSGPIDLHLESSISSLMSTSPTTKSIPH